MKTESSETPILPFGEMMRIVHLTGSRSLQDNSTATESTNGDGIDEDSASGVFFPSFEGYLSLEFSLFLQEHAHNVVALTQFIENEVEGRLDSVMLMFLCSRSIDMVFSPNPTSLRSVCPFQGNKFDQEEKSGGDRLRRNLMSYLKEWNGKWSRMLGSEGGHREALMVDIDDPTTMLLWNVPKIENQVLMLDRSSSIDEDGIVIDNDLNYFTKWTFTYPVYNWGPHIEDDDVSDEDRIQFLLDESIESGAFETILPWEDAKVSVVGREMQIFAGVEDSNNDTDANVSYYDTEIPHSTAKLLQGIGSALVIFNTIFLILMTILAKRQRLRKEKEAELVKNNPIELNAGGGLGTEQGVSEMLMESKLFAIEKSQEFRKSSGAKDSVFRGKNSPSPVVLSTSSSPSTKDSHLLSEAAGHKKEFAGRLLEKVSSDEEDKDDDINFTAPSPNQKRSSHVRKG
ncbi:hypothetical protein IV203_034041 [Nitzschia inconspicua]|uniref:Uncharacterized protein n=1 Tax=Nitzschia inconspicua TaxID=303405 RepID=A0A9K3Q6I4_9STRA|nr:hypothetical protein IV203_034041 [Nitzschia inconspicua]